MYVHWKLLYTQSQSAVSARLTCSLSASLYYPSHLRQLKLIHVSKRNREFHRGNHRRNKSSSSRYRALKSIQTWREQTWDAQSERRCAPVRKKWVFSGLHKRRLINLTPSDFWQEQYHTRWTPAFHSCPSIWKTLFFFFFLSTVCPNSQALWPFFVFLLSKHLKREIILIVDQQGQHLSIQFSTTQRFIHVTWTHTCDFRESVKQNRPPADILDQTVRPFRVKKWLPCALWVHTEAMPRWPAGWAALG